VNEKSVFLLFSGGLENNHRVALFPVNFLLELQLAMNVEP
jgi:hypothetical protein